MPLLYARSAVPPLSSRYRSECGADTETVVRGLGTVKCAYSDGGVGWTRYVDSRPQVAEALCATQRSTPLHLHGTAPPRTTSRVAMAMANNRTAHAYTRGSSPSHQETAQILRQFALLQSVLHLLSSVSLDSPDASASHRNFGEDHDSLHLRSSPHCPLLFAVALRCGGLSFPHSSVRSLCGFPLVRPHSVHGEPRVCAHRCADSAAKDRAADGRQQRRARARPSAVRVVQ